MINEFFVLLKSDVLYIKIVIITLHYQLSIFIINIFNLFFNIPYLFSLKKSYLTNFNSQFVNSIYDSKNNFFNKDKLLVQLIILCSKMI